MISRLMKIECVTVCVNYTDFLEVTLPHNLVHVDHMTVVTSKDDRGTQSLCHKLGVNCLPTDCFYRDTRHGQKPKFNKSRGINYGLMNQRCDDWLLHIDADILLPLWTRKMLMNAELDPTCIYGADRANCIGAENWKKYLASPEYNYQYEYSCFITPPLDWKIGSRLAHGDYGGYVPIGFFQLWNAAGSGIKRYPIVQDCSAEHSDVLHSIRWERPKRILLPEFYVIHLESERIGKATNWNGRISKPFDIDNPDKSKPHSTTVDQAIKDLYKSPEEDKPMTRY